MKIFSILFIIAFVVCLAETSPILSGDHEIGSRVKRGHIMPTGGQMKGRFHGDHMRRRIHNPQAYPQAYPLSYFIG
uniref:Uncharacterized protein n=1 Tax=Acrobeloides nanus TaxID=290746 RepID=A0A914DE53_9BILA